MVKKRIKPVAATGHGSIFAPDNTTDTTSTDKETVAFCFHHIRNGYHFDDCNEAELRHVLRKFSDLSQITWDALRKLGRHAKGYEKIHQNSIKVGLPTNVPGDRAYFAFRLGGKGNAVFIGCRKDRILQIIWLDPKGKVYSHG